MARHQVALLLTDTFLESAFYMDLCKLAAGKGGCIQLHSRGITNPRCQKSLASASGPIFVKKENSIFIYLLSKLQSHYFSLPAPRGLQWCKISIVQRRGVALLLIWRWKVGLEGSANNWADEKHSVGFPSCQSHLGFCCQGHNLKCRWHTSRQHPIYQWAPDYSWLSYIIIPSHLIVKRRAERGVIAPGIFALNFYQWSLVLKYSSLRRLQKFEFRINWILLENDTQLMGGFLFSQLTV